MSSCRFRIHVARGTWASDAQYKIYDVDSTNEGSARFFAHFDFGQHDYDAGGWYPTGRFTFHAGTGGAGGEVRPVRRGRPRR